ncbi:carboxypeptidase-like regulatory domain-containing protein [Aureisphaera galaxeae]|uniref:carboxypeptidase-like regulatory domain-containing protein n=1 Tax=Aureisphaera galaxeae TaxID=1538023 RepID=UPI00234FE5B6|nr:carboxypeptidase-like regulatory domain-containing protein [Aureisphaera galaxeae]
MAAPELGTNYDESKLVFLVDSTWQGIDQIDSEITELQPSRINDATSAILYGDVFYKTFTSSDSENEPMAFAIITARDIKTDSIYEEYSRLNGAYKLKVSASCYDFEVSYVGYNTVKVTNVCLQEGELLGFTTKMGVGNSVNEYYVDEGKLVRTDSNTK